MKVICKFLVLLLVVTTIFRFHWIIVELSKGTVNFYNKVKQKYIN